MKYYELTVSVVPKEDIPLKSVGATIGQHISYCMHQDEKLSQLHKETGVKLFCFDYLYPRAEAKDGSTKYYFKGKKYAFRLRTPLHNLVGEFAKVLAITSSDRFFSVGVNFKEIEMVQIGELYTATPLYLTLNDGEDENDYQLLTKKIVDHLEKKYELIFGESIKTTQFIEFIQKENRKPIALTYKSGTLIGHKFKMAISGNEEAQKLAYVALSAGLLEKTSAAGCGFMIGRKV